MTVAEWKKEIQATRTGKLSRVYTCMEHLLRWEPVQSEYSELKTILFLIKEELIYRK